MNLNRPIVVSVNPMKKSDGSYKVLPPITLKNLDFTILDDVNKKICSVRIKPFPVPLVLWSGESYDDIGDYTQEDVENRILEILGNDPAEVLKNLVPAYAPLVK